MPRQRATTRDWLFGARGKRRLLEELLSGGATPRSLSELAVAVDVNTRGSLDEHLLALQQVNLVERTEQGYRLNEASDLVKPLRDLVAALGTIPEESVRRP